jgi:hypothetical protein
MTSSQKKGKSYPNFNDAFEWIGVLKNLRRSLVEARERQMPIFFAPMSYTGEDYTTWTHLSSIHKEMYGNRLFEAGSWGTDFHLHRRHCSHRWQGRLRRDDAALPADLPRDLQCR